MKRAGLLLLWGAAALVLAGFAMPWVKVNWQAFATAEQTLGLPEGLGRITIEVHGPGGQAQLDSAKLATLPRAVSGWQLPLVLRRPEAQVALTFWDLKQGAPQHLAEKSWAVYLAPALIVLLAALATWAPYPAALTAALAAVAISTVLGMRAVQFMSNSEYTAAGLGHGIWMTIVGYGAAAVAAALVGAQQQRRR